MTDRVKSKYCKQMLLHCHFVHHKSHMDCPVVSWIEGRKAGELSPEFL